MNIPSAEQCKEEKTSWNIPSAEFATCGFSAWSFMGLSVVFKALYELAVKKLPCIPGYRNNGHKINETQNIISERMF